jgi:uncharacterized protein
MQIELRYLSTTGPDGAGLLVKEDSGKRTIQGYASVFNSLSQDIGGGKRELREIIRPGAFAPLLARGVDVRGLIDHDPSKILGRTKSGTLRLEEDSRGLRFEIDPPDTQTARDLMCSLQRGDVDGASFAFTVAPGGESFRSENGCYIREIRAMGSLEDVSVVTYPVYPASEAALRSLSHWEAAQPPAKVETRASTLGDLMVGDMVQWWSEDAEEMSAWICYGRVMDIKADGPLGIPGTSLSLIGTSDDPASLVVTDDGDDDDDDGILCLLPFSKLTKIMPSTDYQRSLQADYDRLRLARVGA